MLVFSLALGLFPVWKRLRCICLICLSMRQVRIFEGQMDSKEQPKSSSPDTSVLSLWGGERVRDIPLRGRGWWMSGKLWCHVGPADMFCLRFKQTKLMAKKLWLFKIDILYYLHSSCSQTSVLACMWAFFIIIILLLFIKIERSLLTKIKSLKRFV